jgi:hypothetical protein
MVARLLYCAKVCDSRPHSAIDARLVNVELPHRRMVVARNSLINMHKPRHGEQTMCLVRPTFVWTDKEMTSEIKSTT